MKTSFYNTFIIKTLKTLTFSQIIIRESYQKIGSKLNENQLLRYFYRPKLKKLSFYPK